MTKWQGKDKSEFSKMTLEHHVKKEIEIKTLHGQDANSNHGPPYMKIEERLMNVK